MVILSRLLMPPQCHYIQLSSNINVTIRAGNPQLWCYYVCIRTHKNFSYCFKSNHKMSVALNSHRVSLVHMTSSPLVSYLCLIKSYSSRSTSAVVQLSRLLHTDWYFVVRFCCYVIILNVLKHFQVLPLKTEVDDWMDGFLKF